MGQNWVSAREQGDSSWSETGRCGNGVHTGSRTHQKGAKEDEGDKVEVGEVTPTLRGIGELVAGPAAEAGQHDLMPGLPGGTPEMGAEREARRGGPGLAGKEAQGFGRAAFPPTGVLHRC